MTGSTRLVVALAFVGSLFLQLSWVVAVPPYRGMDEFDHVYRAEAVAAGHWLPLAQDPAHQGRGDLVRVSAATVRAAYPICHSYSYIQEIDCLPARTYADGTVLVASGAARYNPAYYWVLGTPTRWFGPVTALYLMRGLDALVCSLLVALAAWSLTRWSRTAWPLLGLALTCTPMAMYSGSTPAPNGPEMFAGVAVWAALLGLARVDAGTPVARSLLLAALPPALVLVTLRTLGPAGWPCSCCPWSRWSVSPAPAPSSAPTPGWCSRSRPGRPWEPWPPCGGPGRWAPTRWRTSRTVTCRTRSRAPCTGCPSGSSRPSGRSPTRLTPPPTWSTRRRCC